MKIAMILCFLAIAFVIGSASIAKEHNYLNREQLEELYGEHTSLMTRDDKVPLVFNEKVLFTEGRGIARTILFVVPLPYKVVKEQLSDAIEEEFGIKGAKEYPWRLDQVYRPEVGHVEKARRLGIILGKYIETRIISDRYNEYERSIFGKPKYYSELEVEIADGESIFNKSYSLIQLRRKDHWPDWSGGHPVIQWLPWKTTMYDYIVTKGEVEFVVDVLNNIKAPFILSYPHHSKLSYRLICVKKF